MERFWAPWRMAYITAAGAGDAARADDTARAGERAGEQSAELAMNRSSAQCVFCRRTESGPDAHLVLDRTRTMLIVLNKFPYVRGHLMVCPSRHVPNLGALSSDERRDLGRETRRAARALREVYGPDTVYIGSNLGRAAGAGVPGHMHVHLVPRIAADHPTGIPSRTDRAPETLEESSDRLRRVLRA